MKSWLLKMFITKPATKYVLVLLLIIYAAIATFPRIQIIPMETGADPSWWYAINYIPNSNYLFGQDVVFTYGPLGYLLQTLDIGQNLVISNTFWIVLYVLFYAFLIYLLFKRKQFLPLSLFIIVYILSLAMLNASFVKSYSMFQQPYLLLLLIGMSLYVCVLDDDRIYHIPVFISGVLAGLSLFMKLNLGLSALGMLIVFSLFFLLKSRRKNWPWLLTVWSGCLISVIAVFLVYFKNYPNLIQWIRASIEIINGYGAAMTYGTVQVPLLVIALLVLVFYIVATVFLIKRRSNYSYLSLLFFIPVVLAFKESFVRQDLGHLLTFFVFLPLVMSLFFLFMNSKKTLKWLASIFVLTLVLVVIIPYVVHPYRYVDNDFSRAATFIDGNFGWTNISSQINLTEKRAQIASQSQQNLENDRLPSQWVSIIGNDTVDVVPTEICYIPANNLNWSPEPILQTYQEYTSYLDSWCASHFSGNTSPRYLIVEFADIDGRHPFFSVPATWRNIILNYEVLDFDQASKRLLLKAKSINNESDILININETRSKIGQWVDVPSSDKLLFAKIDMQVNFAGKITGTLYLIPPVNIDLVYHSGLSASWRIIPDTLENGALINFLPSNTKELNQLISGNASDRVESFRIYGPGADYYASDINITWMESSYQVNYNPIEMNTQELNFVGDNTLCSIDEFNELQPYKYNYTFDIDTQQTEMITISGWAVDQEARAAAHGVFIDIDGQKDIPGIYGTPRYDVSNYFKNKNYAYSGFSASFRTILLAKGKHILSLKIITADGKGYYEPGIKVTIFVK